MLKPFSTSINPQPLSVDSISSESLAPLKPFSEGISTYQETLAIVQPGTTISDYTFRKLSKIPWWKAARKLAKKGAPWEDILDAVKFSHAGKKSGVQITDKHKYWAKILQNGWPEEHGEPGERFSYAKGNKDILPVNPETGSVTASFFTVTNRLLKTWGRKIAEGDIAVALEIYVHGGDLTKDQHKILQAGWPHLVGPPGVPFKKYHPDADKLKNMFPARTAPDYDTIKKLQARGFFLTRDKKRRNKILDDLDTYIKGYEIPFSKDTQKLLQSPTYGFSKSQVQELKKLAKGKPDPGYTRYVNPDAVPKTVNEAFNNHHKRMVEVIGFIDLDESNVADEIFYKKGLTPKTIPEMTREKVPEQVREEKKPSWIEKIVGKPVPKEKPKEPKEKPKFSRTLKFKMQGMEGRLTKRQRAKIRVLKDRGTEPNYKRFTYDKFPPGTDEWIMAYLFHFVDIDKKGDMHPAFVGGKSAELTRFYQAGMNYHRDVGYY